MRVKCQISVMIAGKVLCLETDNKLSHIRAQLLGMYSTVRGGGKSQDRANTFSPPHQSNYIMQRASCGLRPTTRTELHCIMYSNRKPKSTKKIEDYSFCYCFNKTKGVE